MPRIHTHYPHAQLLRPPLHCPPSCRSHRPVQASPHPSRLVVHIPHTRLHHTNAPMGMHVHPSHTCTPCTRIDVPIHAYTRIHHVHTHHICACLGEPRPHTRYPPTFPTPFTHANPCVPTHQPPSPHSFPGHTGSVWVRVCLHITWGIWTHGPPSWTLIDHTDSCHTSPRSVHPALTLIPLLAAPPGVVSLWGWWGAMVC